MIPLPFPVKAVLDIAEDAGKLLARMQGNVGFYHKADGSPYTEADIAANEQIRYELSRLTPHIPVVAEEDDRDEAEHITRTQHTYWLVDPLDVTTNYIKGGNAWSLNIGLLHEGVPVLGVLNFHGRGEIYYTGDDGRAHCLQTGQKPRIIRVKQFDDESYHAKPINKPVVIAAHPSHLDPLQCETEQGVELVTSHGQHRACLVASGKALCCSERAGFKAWDTAATFAIVRAAGGDMVEEDGSVLSFRQRVKLPIYHVGHPRILETLVGELKPEGDVPIP
jgi:3'(2'), 5'-bisphosphate nucleotidase